MDYRQRSRPYARRSFRCVLAACRLPHAQWHPNAVVDVGNCCRLVRRAGHGPRAARACGTGGDEHVHHRGTVVQHRGVCWLRHPTGDRAHVPPTTATPEASELRKSARYANVITAVGPDLRDPGRESRALADEVPAAHTKVIADAATGRIWSDGTGTLPRHWGRGLAKLVNSVSMRRAVDAG